MDTDHHPRDAGAAFPSDQFFPILRAAIFRLIRRSILWSAGAVALLVLFAVILPLPPHKPYSLVIDDRNGSFLHAFLTTDDKWRLKTSVEEIPEKLKQMLLEKEDRYFFLHPGVNPLAVVRAAFQNLTTNRLSGASTITMQVARLLEPKERTLANKLIEMFRAVQLELHYSKDEILTMYLSMVPLGGNIEGLRSASLVYYETPLERLNIAQLIDLILIPNSPNSLRPDRNDERLYEARLRIARVWRDEGLLDEREMETIAQTPARVSRHTLPQLAPHFSLRVRDRVSNGASTVQSSLDLPTQRAVERLVANHVRPWKAKGVRNAAALVVENATGMVRAYVGSPDFSDSSSQGQVDAVRALRSPGSTLKPLLYAFALDRGLLTPKARLLDVPYDIGGYAAENYDGTFSGLVYADDALRRSLNAPMVRLLEETGLDPFTDILKKLGFSSIERQRDGLGLSMILGGCGVTLEELVTSYSSLPRGGVRGRLLFRADDQRETEDVRAFGESAAYMVANILSDMPRTDLPERIVSAAHLPTIAFKTGTSYGRRDAWCIGFSRTYTVGVWLGNVTNEGVADLVGQQSATPLLIDILNAVARNDASEILPMPDDIGVRHVCAHSGQLPTEWCKERIADLYSYVSSPTRVCDVDREYLISPSGNYSYCTSCVGTRPHRVTSFAAYAPELLTYWKRTGTPFAEVPPHAADCERVYAHAGPKILSPSNDMTYFIVEASQKIPIVASSGVDVRTHYWYLNNRFLGAKASGERIFLSLDEGQHALTCLDEKGRATKVTFVVKHVM